MPSKSALTVRPPRDTSVPPPITVTVLVLAAFLSICVALVFCEAGKFGFLNYDDNQYIHGVPEVTAGLTPASIAWAFTHSHVGQWHPLTTLSWMMDVSFFGLNGTGFHLHNVILHLVATILLFFAAHSLTGAVWRSALMAALFGLHPLRVESVAWIAERKDVLSGVFMMATLWAYSAYARRACSRKRLALVCVIFALGLLAKPMLVTLPVVLLLLDVWPLGRFKMESTAGGIPVEPFWRQALPLLREKIPLFALSVAASVIAVVGQGAHNNPIKPLQVAQRLSYIPVSYVNYLIKLLWPVNLSAHYPYSADGPAVWMLVASVLFLFVTTGLVIKFRKQCPVLLVGWLWFIITLLPVIGIFYNGIQIRADRYTYVSQIGLIMAVVWCAADIARNKFSQRFFAVVACALVAVLMVCSSRQVPVWQSDLVLWQNAVATTSDNFYAESKLGKSLQDQNDIKGAEEHYREALRLNPDGIEALNNLACIVSARGSLDEAIELQRRTVTLFPEWHLMHHNLGQIYMQKGDVLEAKKSYLRAAELAPQDLQINFSLASLLAERFGDRASLEEAVSILERTLKFHPEHAESRFLLGNTLYRLSRTEEAIASYRKTIDLEPGHSRAENNLGVLLNGTGKNDEAMKLFTKAIQDDGKNMDAYTNLAQTLAKNGAAAEAVKVLRAALESAPNHAGCLTMLAWVLSTSSSDSVRNGFEATQFAHRAAELTGVNNVEILDALAAAYAETGRFTEAQETAGKALAHPALVNDPDRAAQIRQRQELYRGGRPFREGR